MGQIPVSGGGDEAQFRWADGQKQVYTDHRVDIYENGDGRPDGPGHDHYWFTYNNRGDVTSEGGRVG